MDEVYINAKNFRNSDFSYMFHKDLISVDELVDKIYELKDINEELEDEAEHLRDELADAKAEIRDLKDSTYTDMKKNLMDNY